MEPSNALTMLCICLFIHNSSIAQYLDPTRSNFGTVVALDNRQNLFTNPASYDDHQKTYFWAGAQSLFQLKEIQNFQLGYLKTGKNHCVGISGIYFGSEYLKSYTVQSQFARQLFNQLNLAIRFKMTNIDLDIYGKRNVVNADIGMHYSYSAKWEFAFLIQQIKPIQIAEFEQSGAKINLGLAYIPSNKVRFMLEIYQNATSGSGLRCALEYKPAKQVLAHTGMQSNPTIALFGIQYRISKKVTVESFGNYHLVLGLTSGVNLKVMINDK
ncbi:MAG: hypothetical protein ACOYOA_12955 [Saprospiraceae bacterium]